VPLSGNIFSTFIRTGLDRVPIYLTPPPPFFGLMTTHLVSNITKPTPKPTQFSLEDGGNMFQWNIGNGHKSTWFHSPEDRNFDNYCKKIISTLTLFTVNVCMLTHTVTCMSVTEDGVWIRDWIYWSLQHTTREYK
jgi:hypothetical protein